MNRRTFLIHAARAGVGLFTVGGSLSGGVSASPLQTSAGAGTAWRALRRNARRHGYRVDLSRRPWPWPGSVQRWDTGGVRLLVATIDSRRSSAEQTRALEWVAAHVNDVVAATNPFLAMLPRGRDA